MAVEVVVLDVNGTLSDLTALEDAFADAGAPPYVVEQWFAATLRDGIALSSLGAPVPFRDVATGVLRRLLPREAGAETVLDALLRVPVHPDVVRGMQALREAGLRLVTLTNGSLRQSAALLAGAGMTDVVEQQLSVDDAGRWKPHPEAYAHAVAACGVAADRLVMLAAHPWDLDGAARAGLRTCWLDREGLAWPGVFSTPDCHVRSLVDAPAAVRQLG